MRWAPLSLSGWGEHRRYLGDERRVAAYVQAVREVVRPGMVVLDLGAGTGLLGLLACVAGAARVYAVEVGPILEVAQELARANGFADRIVHLRCHSAAAELPERVDLVLGDQLSAFVHEYGLLEQYRDARERHLRPGGQLMPSSVEPSLAPVEDAEAYGFVDVWSQRPSGLELGFARARAANVSFAFKMEERHLLAPVQALPVVDLHRWSGEPFGGTLSFTAARAGTLHGLGGAVMARLSPGVSFSTRPDDPERIARNNVMFPLSSPVPVEAGDRIEATVRVFPEQEVERWSVTVRSASGDVRAREDHSTFAGALVDRPALERERRDYVPTLGGDGDAWRFVLQRCDGVTPRAALEDQLRAAFPERFARAGEAQSFVSRVLAAVVG